MILFFLSLALLQNAPHQSWEQHLSDLVFEGHLENHQLMLLDSSREDTDSWKIVADGVTIPLILRIFHNRDESAGDDQDSNWLFGAIESYNPAQSTQTKAWRKSVPAPPAKGELEAETSFSDSFEIKVFQSLKDLRGAVEHGEIDGWICPEFFDMAFPKVKTIQLYRQNQHFSWWASPEILQQESTLKYSLKTLIRDVTRFQTDKSRRKQILLQFLEPLDVSTKMKKAILKKMLHHSFMSPAALPLSVGELVDSRWYFLAQRLVPPVPGELLEVTDR
jgi:hypothetical protein